MKKTKPFEWNKVTSLSKYLAMTVFIIFPLIAFIAGIKYQQLLTYENNSIGNNVSRLINQKAKNDNDLTGNFTLAEGYISWFNELFQIQIKHISYRS